MNTAAVVGAFCAGLAAVIFWWQPRRSLARSEPDVDHQPRPIPTAVGWIRGRISRRSDATKRRQAALEVVSGFAAELKAGQPLGVALQRCVESVPVVVCPHAIAVVRLGGDLPQALLRDAREQRLPILRSLSALWQVAEGSGAGLAAAADRLATAETNAEEVRRELMAQLAGPRATARVLAGLPAVGLMLGTSLGASPVKWLLGTPWGLTMLAAGLVLEALGLFWTSRLTQSVEALL
ncbi:MAG: type II secretion system F family protein [Candidatus Nanopelagicales bacterium]|nr:type II secretion system F family protein [Candidatus Nanopelagicales bacterium]